MRTSKPSTSSTGRTPATTTSRSPKRSRSSASAKTPGHRPLRQWHRPRRSRAEALVRQRQRRHPPEHRQPEERVHRPFFSTIQLLMAGNDTQGLRYGVIETGRSYLADLEGGSKTTKHGHSTSPSQMCEKSDFWRSSTTSSSSTPESKKTCRHNQYLRRQGRTGACQEADGGIIWHAQGIGKSLTMVWLAKWIARNADGCPSVSDDRPRGTR